MPTYNYGGDIASGLSLQAKPKDYVSLIGERMKLDALDKKQKLSADKEKLIDWKDFKTENKDLYPYYARQDAEVGADIARKYNQYRSSGMSETAAQNTLLMNDLPTFKERRDAIMKSNELAKAHQTKEDLYTDPQVKSTMNQLLMSTDTTPEQFDKAVNNPEKGVYSKNGLFSFDAQKDIDFNKIIKDIATVHTNDIDPSVQPERIPLPDSGGKYLYKYKTKPSPEAAETITNSILSNNEESNLFLKKYGIKVKDYGDPDINQAKIKDEVNKKVVSLMPSSWTTDKEISPYHPPASKPTGYNKGTGEASGDRFNSEKTTDGGVLSPVSGTEKFPQAHISSTYALRGDATEDDAKYADKTKEGKLIPFEQDVDFQKWKVLTNPKTGKKGMFFVVNKASAPVGSSSEKTVTDPKTGATHTENTKTISADQTWLVPATPDQQKKFFTYTGNKNGTNPHKESFLDDLAAMNKFNLSAGSGKSTKGSQSKKQTTDNPYDF